MDLSQTIAGRHSEYPAPVIHEVTIRSPSGRLHPRRWEGIVDTGADLCVVPVDLATDLQLGDVHQRVRVWTYRKDEQPREVDVYYLRFEFPWGLKILTKAIAAPRSNLLIGRCALLKMRLTVDWPANRWDLEVSNPPDAIEA